MPANIRVYTRIYRFDGDAVSVAAAPIHRNMTVSHCTVVAFTAKTLPGVAGGTKCGVLFAVECKSMTSSRLPWVRSYSHPIATEIATTVIR